MELVNKIPSIDAVQIYSDDNNTTLAYACAALQSPLINKVEMWGTPTAFTDNSAASFSRLTRRTDVGLMSRLAHSISDVIRFPVSTAFLHGLGCVSAALNKGFSIKYHNETTPLNLYIITAQRPSTGKTGIHDYFFNPIYAAYKDVSDRTAPRRTKLQRDLINEEKKLEKQLATSANNDDIDATVKTIANIKEELITVPEWRCNLTDATIEAAENVAGKQGGMFNIVTAEADAINVITGGVYGDSKSKKNLGLILAGWGGEHVSSARVTRDGIDMKVRATVSILAQNDAVDTILAAGESGRGITERFLLLAEPSLLGKRGPLIYDKQTFNALSDEYKTLIDNIIREEKIIIDFDKSSEKYMRDYITGLEPQLADDGKYANDLISGFMGKAEKHIRKLAAVLHCVDEWGVDGSRSKLVKINTLIRAIGIFNELADRFLDAADSLGHSGEQSEIEKLTQYITERVERGKMKMTVNALRDNLKNTKPFRGTPNLSKRLREHVLPILCEHNFITVAHGVIYINPRLK